LKKKFLFDYKMAAAEVAETAAVQLVQQSYKVLLMGKLEKHLSL
jgi:hypothetical protein